MSDTPPIFRDGLLAGQVGLVTGGGTGIGFGIAQLLARLGMHVVLASRKPEHLEPAAARIREAGGMATPIALDVRDTERVRGVFEEVQGRLGRLDLLVNNAAGNFYVPSAEMSPNAWRAVLDIDLSGTFFCSQAAFAIMRGQGGGRIVNVSMTLHYRGWPLMAHATAAKAGIDALTRTLAVEWAPHGVRVNAVAPGPVPTEGVRKAFTPPPGSDATDLFAVERHFEEHARRAIPLGRMGRPDDVANVVAFLAGPGGDWMTGAIIVVDGGEWLARPASGAVPPGTTGGD
jgi:2,4-dienoyl-CoA reductase [(3E)-enoyl-CoA-producing], peroxisomal